MQNLSGFFTRNLTLKVSAFAVALLLWLSVQWETPGQVQYEDVSVRVDLADPDWVLVGDPEPAGVRVAVSGAAGELSRTGRPAIVVPMDAVTNSDTTVVLLSQWVRLPDRPGLVVDDIQPMAVGLTFEPVERRSAPLAFALENELPDGLALAGAPLPANTEVRVTGPRSRIAEIDSVRFGPLDLSGLSGVGTGTVTLPVDSLAVQGLQVQPATIEIDYRLEESVERTLAEVPVVWADAELSEAFEAVAERQSVLLEGARSRVERVDPAQVEIVIEFGPDAVLPDPGEEIEAPYRVRGLPDWIEATLESGALRLMRRPEGS